MSPYVSLAFDVVIFLALAATIFYAWRLTRQLDKIHSDRKAFEQLIQALDLSSSRAEAAIRALKETAAGSGDHLQERINAARSLSEELEIMVQAGDNLAERLQILAEKGRKAVMPESHETVIDEPAFHAQPKTRAEKELLDALRKKHHS